MFLILPITTAICIMGIRSGPPTRAPPCTTPRSVEFQRYRDTIWELYMALICTETQKYHLECRSYRTYSHGRHKGSTCNGKYFHRFSDGVEGETPLSKNLIASIKLCNFSFINHSHKFLPTFKPIRLIFFHRRRRYFTRTCIRSGPKENKDRPLHVA